MTSKTVLVAGAVFLLSACQTLPAQQTVSDRTMRVFETLASDDMQGRRPGTEGHRKAQAFLIAEVEALNAFDDFREQPFDFERPIRDEQGEVKGSRVQMGNNLIGLFDMPDNDAGPILVITAHYDHLGMRGDEIYNGADDNASGSAALFSIAESFKANPPQHDVMLVWLDAEEMGLSGASALLDGEDNFNGRPVFNLNLDMISQNEDELYFAGAYHMPALKPLIEQAALDTGLTLSFGHDAPEDGGDDWTLQSDHGVFHRRGIPFGYFGVEDHPHYHQPTDEFATIPQAFYAKSVRTVVNAARILDANLGEVARAAEDAE